MRALALGVQPVALLGDRLGLHVLQNLTKNITVQFIKTMLFKIMQYVKSGLKIQKLDQIHLMEFCKNL